MNDLLLVDDEPASLNSLYTALDWSEYGFHHVHIANSASEALHIMAKNSVDLIILDIQMPQMNGIEMLKEVRNRFPAARCILVSAYSKFEYAKEALQLNVENYLLKPIDINELRETVAHAAESIYKTGVISHNLFERSFLERWLQGRITNDELIEHSQYTHYNVLLRHYFVIMIHGTESTVFPLHSLAATFPRDIAVYPLHVDESTEILLCGGHDLSTSLIEEIIAPFSSLYPDLRIACGSLAVGSGNVSKSCADAKYILEYARLGNLAGCLFFEKLSGEVFFSSQIAQLADLLQASPSENQVRNFIHSFIAEAEKSGRDYRSLYAYICLTLMGQIEEPDLKNIVLPPISAPYTREQLINSIITVIQLLVSRQQYNENLSPVVQSVISYIRNNLSGSISIKNFCENKNMNPTYIGRLFKKELGMYFSEYVCTLRINKAKYLLENTSFSVSDIAKQVGIYDVSYFVQCYKKQERISPMKYRQTVLQRKS